MNSVLKKSSQYIALILLLCSPFSLPAFADEPKAPVAPGSAKQTAINVKALAEQKQQIVKEAAESIADTQKALDAIEINNPKKALGILQEVLGKLDVILAKYPAMELVSADIDTNIIEFEGDANAAKKAIDAADDFLDDGKIQDARQILDELISEAWVTTTSIPLKSFPAAIKQAVAYLSNGKTNAAGNTLYEVLNTLDKTTEIIPLPVLHAEILLTEASEMEHKLDLSQERSRAEVLKLADAAKDQLKLAELLGYGSKNDYKLLYTAIDEIDEAIFSKKSSAMWSTIKQHLATLKNKLTHLKK